MNNIVNIIKKAKEKYPLSVSMKYKFTEKEMTELEQFCEVRCPSVYMDGSGYYCIRYKGELI